jgi:hypothetical protein
LRPEELKMRNVVLNAALTIGALALVGIMAQPLSAG